MYSSHLRYQATGFVDAESVAPSTDDITQLISAFDFAPLVPTTIMEASAGGLSGRLSFVSQDGSWRLNLLSKAFQVLRVANDPLTTNLGDFATFCEEGSIMLCAVFRRFNRRPHRLASVREGFLGEMDDGELDRIGKCLMKFPPPYAENRVTEWDWRAVIQQERGFAGLREPLNTITIMKRVIAVLTSAESGVQGREFPRIRADFDINTSADNTVARFEEEHIRGFFAEAPGWHNELESETARFIGLISD